LETFPVTPFTAVNSLVTIAKKPIDLSNDFGINYTKSNKIQTLTSPIASEVIKVLLYISTLTSTISKNNTSLLPYLGVFSVILAVPTEAKVGCGHQA